MNRKHMHRHMRALAVVMLMSALVLSLVSCENAKTTTTGSPESVSTSSTPDISGSADASSNPDSSGSADSSSNDKAKNRPSDWESENLKTAKMASDSGIVASFEKPLYPAEKVLKIEEIPMPERIENCTYSVIDAGEDYFLVMLNDDQINEDGSINAYQGEVVGPHAAINPWKLGVYYYDSGEFTLIRELPRWSRAAQFAPAGARDFTARLLDSERVAFFYFNTDRYTFEVADIKTGDAQIVLELSSEGYGPWNLPLVYFAGDKIVYQESGNSSSLQIKVLDTKSGEEISTGEDTKLIGITEFEGGLAYAAIDEDYYNNKKLRLVGADFDYSWTQKGAESESLSDKYIGSPIAQAGGDLYALNKIYFSPLGMEQVPTPTGEEISEYYDKNNNPDDFGSFDYLEGEEFSQMLHPLYLIRNLRTGEILMYSRVALMLKPVGAGRFLVCRTKNTETWSQAELLFDTKLDLMLYFQAPSYADSTTIIPVQTTDSGYVIFENRHDDEGDSPKTYLKYSAE